MNRNLLIILALALPVVAIVMIARQAPDMPAANDDARRLPPTELSARPTRNSAPTPISLDEARRRVREELARLNKLTPEQWDAEQRMRIARGMPLPPPPGGEATESDTPQELPAPQKDD